jgi:hypothetical protein
LWAQQTATVSSDADQQRAEEQFDPKFQNVTPVEGKLSIKFSNIETANYFRKSEPRQPTLEAYSVKNLLKQRRRQTKRFMKWQ